jgi:hypothetical protein
MSNDALDSFLARSTGPDEDRDDASIPNLVVEEDDDLAGAIESWFEKGDDFDRRYDRVDNHTG